MLRVVLTLDCDRCKQSYYQAAVCTDPEPFFWESFAYDLKCCASGDGWYTGEDETDNADLVCAECLESEPEEPEEWPAELCE